MVEDLDDYEPGLNLDNDSLIVTGDNGIPIKGFNGQRTTLTHEEQAHMRQVYGCGHKNTRLDVNAATKRMAYSCEDCGISIIEGHVTSFVYQSSRLSDDVNNPFISGKH